MGFKDIIKNDIANIFLREDEFAQTAEINGKMIPVITDEDILKEKERGGMGIYENARTIYISEEHMKRPKQGSILVINKQTFTVASATSNMGMLEIVVERNSGR